MSKIYSKGALVATPVTIIVDPRWYNWTVAVDYFDDAAMTSSVTPTAGTVTVEGRVPGAGGNSAFNASPIDSTSPADFASAGSPLDLVVATPAGITGNGVTHYKVTITGTEG